MHKLLGSMNSYWLTWPKWAHLLKALLLDPRNGYCFHNYESILAYPNHKLPFYIHMDASDYQIGAIVVQQKYPVAYWSHKLSEIQQNYHSLEKEFSSLSWSLKNFALCSLVPNSSFIHSTKFIFHLKLLLQPLLVFFYGILLSHHPFLPWQKISLPLHSHSSMPWYAADSRSENAFDPVVFFNSLLKAWT